MLNAFLASLIALYLLIHFWLSKRQIKHIRINRHQVPTKFAGSVTLDAHQKAADYSVAKTIQSQLDHIFSAGLTVFWLWMGGLKYLDSFWMDRYWNETLTGLAVLASIMIIHQLVHLPLAIWNTFYLEEKFGFNQTNPKVFFLDQFKETTLTLLIVLPLAAAVLWIMDHIDQWWWIGGLIWSGFILLLLWLWPNVLAPIFNQFSPLPAGPLKEKIDQLLKTGGFSNRQIFVMDASKRSSHGNAYFAGFGQNKRIVLFDTLIDQLNEDQIVAVLAHELGHSHFKHIPKQLILQIVTGFMAFWVLQQISDLPTLHFHLAQILPSDYMSLILFTLVAPYFTFAFTPVFNYLSRKYEFKADKHAAQLTGKDHLSQALVTLSQENASTLTPDPLYAQVFYSHPDVLERINAMQASS